MTTEGRRYYAARIGVKPEPINFDLLKKSFLLIYSELESKDYLYEALGHKCVDDGIDGDMFGSIPGLWGDDVESFIFRKTQLSDTWPLKDKLMAFNEIKLFSIIEFIFDYVSEPKEGKHHDWNTCGWHYRKFDPINAKKEYIVQVNDLLKHYNNGYELSDEGYIRQIPPTGMEPLLSASSYVTNDQKNIDNRIQCAIRQFTRYGATLEDKKGALCELGGVLEFLRKSELTIDSKDDDALFNILNNFDIRHHNKIQQKEYCRDIWYDYFFFTFLASIQVLIKKSG